MKQKSKPNQINDEQYQKLKNKYYQPNEIDEELIDDENIELELPRKNISWWKKILVIVFLVILIPVIVVGTWDYINFSKFSDKLFQDSSIFNLINAKPLKSDGNRVNILMVGYSIDDPGHPGATLTDSIMILSMNPTNHTGYMLSIPRDLYVNIPDYGYGKINEAYQIGGIKLLKKISQEITGLGINYYTLINYASVRETVDALGGITVNINSEDSRGLYDSNFATEEGGPLNLKNGEQKINGQIALLLTRARGATFDSYGFALSDFTRSNNQQMVLSSIKDKLTWHLILDPRKNGKIFEAVGNNLKTDLKIGEVLSMYKLAQSIPEGGLSSVSLREINEQVLLSSYTTFIGQSALIPLAGLEDYSQIQKAIRTLN